MSINEHEFNKRSFLDKISNYKTSIFFITLFFISLALIYSLFAEKVYETDATLEVIPKYNLLNSSTSNRASESDYERHFETQMEFLQSRYLIAKVVDSLQSNIEFYKNGRLKPYESLQGESPFFIKNLNIKDESFYKKIFHIKLLDDNHYALSMVSKEALIANLASEKKTMPLVYQFSKPLVSDFMDFTIEKNSLSNEKEIYFKVIAQRDSIDKVLKNLSVIRNNLKSSIIKITYQANSIKETKDFVDGLLQEYKKVTQEQQLSQSESHLTVINRELLDAKESLDESEKRFQLFIEQNGVIGVGIGTQTNNLIENIYKYQSELEDSNILYQNINTIYNIYKKSLDYKDILTQISGLDNANLIKLVDSIEKEDAKYNELLKMYKAKHPTLIKVKNSIKEKSITLEKSLKQLLKNSDDKRVKLKSFIKKYEKILITVPHKEIEYAKLKRDYSLIEKNYLMLLDKKRELDISKKIQDDYTYHVLDAAYLPKVPSKPKTTILLILSSFIGLMIGLFYALIREYFAKKITVPSEVEELTRLPYLGTIPYIKDKKLYNKLFVAKQPESVASQMIWSLRDRIDEFNSGEKGQVIAVTSMVKGEGKTTLAANLAICLGMGDKKTVVLSLDLRLPQIHSKFGIDNSVGLTSVLFGDRKVSDVIFRSSQFKNLFVVPSGPKIPNPMQIINSNYIDEMLEELSELYDYIIIDLPPAGIAAEAVFLMKKADLVISVLKSNYSEKSFVTYMENIAKKSNIKNLGFVLNGVNQKYIKIISRKENRKYINHNRELDQKRKYVDSISKNTKVVKKLNKEVLA